MRFSLALLCFSLIFSAAAAAPPTPAPHSSPTDTYISARDRYLAAAKADPAAEFRALRDLDHLIKRVVPDWKAPGFSPEGPINLVALVEGDVGYGALDGREYSRGHTIVVSSTKPLLTHWLAHYRDGWGARGKIPASITAAFRADAFYTQALAGDGAVFLHGLVLVKAQAGTDLAVVELAAFSLGLPMDRGPDMLLAAVMRGERVFIAQEPLTAKLAPIPYCGKIMERTVARARAEAKASHGDRFAALEEKADREYRACFAQHLREQPNYTAIARQAQALVDLLH